MGGADSDAGGGGGSGGGGDWPMARVVEGCRSSKMIGRGSRVVI